jgi:hypothetical protein
MGFSQTFGSLNSIEDGHRNIEHCNVWVQLGSGVQGRLTVTYGGDNFPFSGHKSTDIFKHLLVVVS